MKLFKKNESKETVKLPMSGKVKKGFRDVYKRQVLKIPTKKKRMRTSVVRTVRTSVPCAENVCVRTSATSDVLPSTEFGYPNSLVRG